MDSKIEEVQRTFLIQAAIFDPQIALARVFMMWSERADENLQKLKLRLFCEHPGGWHLVDDKYEIAGDTLNFIKSLSYYLHQLIKVP